MTAYAVVECNTCRRTQRGFRAILADRGWTHVVPDTDTCPTCTRIGLITFLASLDEPETKP